jgi:hypothetical protein
VLEQVKGELASVHNLVALYPADHTGGLPAGLITARSRLVPDGQLPSHEPGDRSGQVYGGISARLTSRQNG